MSRARILAVLLTISALLAIPAGAYAVSGHSPTSNSGYALGGGGGGGGGTGGTFWWSELNNTDHQARLA